MSKILVFTPKNSNNERVVITLNSLANIHKVSSDLVYVDYYASDPSGKHPFIIERIETNMNYDDIMNTIFMKD